MQILRKLGEGGYAVVHEGRDAASGKRYACKVFDKKTSNRLQVIKEAGIHRRVDQSQISGNVSRYVDITEDARSFIIVTELCEGGPLSKFMQNYSPQEIRDIVRGTLRGLADIHGCGVIHRDIKHANILFKGNAVKIVDFGTSMYFHPGDNAGKVVITNSIKGTPWFLSPEALKHECTLATDVWGVGVLTYHLMTGRYPFDDASNRMAPTLNAIVRSIIEDRPDFKDDAWRGSEASSETIDFVERCLDKSPQSRPSVVECLEHPWMTN